MEVFVVIDFVAVDEPYDVDSVWSSRELAEKRQKELGDGSHIHRADVDWYKDALNTDD